MNVKKKILFGALFLIVSSILLTLLSTFGLAQDGKQLSSVTSKGKIENEQVIVNEQNSIGEYLKLTINLPIKTSGTYKVNSVIKTNKGEYIGQGRLAPMQHIKIATTLSPEEIQLQEGEQTMEIYFDGRELGWMRINGPYIVEIELLGDKYKVIDDFKFTTKYYDYFDFEGCLYKDLTISEHVGKKDSTGLYTSLDINMNLDVIEPGTYLIQGTLYKGEATVATEEIEIDLYQANQDVTLSFNGIAISESKQKGSYDVHIVIGGPTARRDVEYTTQYYNYKKFSKE